MNSTEEKYMVWFFAGGEARDYKFNVFTGSFIKMMGQIMGERFDHIKGIYFNLPMMNVAWALSNAQRPAHSRKNIRMQEIALRQMTSNRHTPENQLIMVSSSSGSVVAAQTACYLAELNSERQIFNKPFHLALGSSMISKESDLFRKLEEHRENGLIGKLIHDDLQDEGDNSVGIGGKSRREAFINAFGLIVPALSTRFSGPSFLNTHPENGHLHRRRSQQVQKAIDYINVLLIKHTLAGEHYLKKALEVIGEIK